MRRRWPIQKSVSPPNLSNWQTWASPTAPPASKNFRRRRATWRRRLTGCYQDRGNRNESTLTHNKFPSGIHCPLKGYNCTIVTFYAFQLQNNNNRYSVYLTDIFLSCPIQRVIINQFRRNYSSFPLNVVSFFELVDLLGGNSEEQAKLSRTYGTVLKVCWIFRIYRVPIDFYLSLDNRLFPVILHEVEYTAVPSLF